MDRCYESHMGNGCPKCEKIKGPPRYPGDHGLCIDCRIEQAEHDVFKAMNRVEQLKKEKEDERDRRPA